MNTELSAEALEYGRLARRAFETAGGDQLVQLAEREPQHRQARIEPILEGLGAWHLDPRGSDDDLEAAAALCRSAGYWAVPYPLAERLSLVVVSDVAPAAPISQIDLEWTAVSLAGARSRATARPSSPPASRHSAFVTDLDLVPLNGAEEQEADVALGLVLPCWTLLGMLDRAVQLTCAYVQARQQFGQPLASFQGVQFQLTDAEVERAGVEVLAKYALWSTRARPEDALTDALALRLAAIEAAEVVFRVSHQLHGAIGFCDETVLSWLSRYSQPLRRLPFGASATRHELSKQVARRGMAGLFG